MGLSFGQIQLHQCSQCTFYLLMMLVACPYFEHPLDVRTVKGLREHIVLQVSAIYTVMGQYCVNKLNLLLMCHLEAMVTGTRVNSHFPRSKSHFPKSFNFHTCTLKAKFTCHHISRVSHQISQITSCITPLSG